MTNKKITDLEKFALEHVVRPYQNMIGFEKRVEKLPFSLETLALMLEDDTEWANLTKDRIRRIGFRFPKYIQHPLVEIFRTNHD